MRPVIALVGRPNVGKSTLFNRIVGQRKAIVDDVPGVTRDRNIVDCDYQGRVFQLMDTGGLDPSASEGMLAQIKHQSELAIREADLLIFLMDGRAGLTPIDEEIVLLLRGIKKPVFWSVNKIDTLKSKPLLADFYQLGLASAALKLAKQRFSDATFYATVHEQNEASIALFTKAGFIFNGEQYVFNKSG